MAGRRKGAPAFIPCKGRFGYAGMLHAGQAYNMQELFSSPLMEEKAAIPHFLQNI